MQYILGLMVYVLLIGPATYSMLKTAAHADAALLEQGALREYHERRIGAQYPQRAVRHPIIADPTLTEKHRRN